MKKLLLIIALFSTSVRADSDTNTIIIADDSSSGTYKKMLGEIISHCSSDELVIKEAKGVTGGSPGNLDALINNKAQAAFLHSDVFLANAMSDPTYKRFQTLIALYPEPIHVLALKQSKTKGGRLGFSTIEFNTLSDLSGYKVGAAGGGVFTAKILTGQGKGGFDVVQYNGGKEVIAALEAGEVSAAVFVGAAPLPNLETIDKNKFKLIPIGESISGNVKGVYRSATINYAGLTTGPVQTLAPVATLMTRKYSTPKKVAAQRHLRDCFNKSLDELKDNGSPNWQQVEANDRGVLDWYEIPTTGTAVKK